MICVGELENCARNGYAAHMEPFTQNILRLIKKAGGQRELAAHAGVSQPTVSKWADGTLPRSMSAAVKMAEWARVSPGDLFERVIDFDALVSPAAEAGRVYVNLPVALPSLERLTTMMRALLNAGGLPDLADEYAERLARLLPNALAQSVADLDDRSSAEPISRAERPQPRAKGSREPRP